MARQASKHPTELELEILKILWHQGAASVRRVRDALAEYRPLAYTSVMTIMTIMTRKKYLKRSKEGPNYIYRPCVTEQSTRRRMLRDLVDRAFDGSAASAMLNLLETTEIDETELEELRKLINRKAKERSQ